MSDEYLEAITDELARAATAAAMKEAGTVLGSAEGFAAFRSETEISTELDELSPAQKVALAEIRKSDKEIIEYFNKVLTGERSASKAKAVIAEVAPAGRVRSQAEIFAEEEGVTF